MINGSRTASEPDSAAKKNWRMRTPFLNQDVETAFFVWTTKVREGCEYGEEEEIVKMTAESLNISLCYALLFVHET